MGYKTKDVKEMEKLLKEGHKIIETKGIPFSGHEYEFDFDIEPKDLNKAVETPKEIEVIEESKEEVKEVKELPKRRGNPNWFGGKNK